MHVRQVFTSLFAAAALAGCLCADPIPVGTSASVNYTFQPPFTVSQTFSFTGPDLSLSGTAFAFSGEFGDGLTPGVPFIIDVFLIQSGEGGRISGTIGGITVPPNTFFPDGPARLTASPAVFNLPGGIVPPPFALDIPPITVPATVAGVVTMCAPLSCQSSGPPETELQFTADIPGTLSIQVVNIESTDHPAYALLSAQFTTVPEPNTAVPMVLALAASLCYVRRRRTREYRL